MSPTLLIIHLTCMHRMLRYDWKNTFDKQANLDSNTFDTLSFEKLLSRQCLESNNGPLWPKRVNAYGVSARWTNLWGIIQEILFRLQNLAFVKISIDIVQLVEQLQFLILHSLQTTELARRECMASCENKKTSTYSSHLWGITNLLIVENQRGFE